MFCSICGSNIITTNELNDFVRGHVIVMSGCLERAGKEGEVNFEPRQEFYCKNKRGWIEVKGTTEKFEGMV